MNSITTALKLIVMTALPVVATIVLKILQVNWEPFKNCKNSTKNIVVGLVFGLCAVYGTEFGVNTGLAIVNTRDAAVLCAGLFFGGPAAAISAVIGSVERFLAPLWGVGAYTRWACSIATFCAGGFTALLRYFFFIKKRPKWHQALAVGVFMEVFHLLLVFVTHMDDIHTAFSVVKACSSAMLLMNGISVMLACIATTYIEGNTLFTSDRKELNTQFNMGIFLAMIFGFTISIAFTFVLEHRLYISDTENTIDLTLRDVDEQTDAVSVSLLSDLTKYRHIYQTGRVIVADNNMNLITELEDVNARRITDLGFTVSIADPSTEMIQATANGVDTFYKYIVKDNYIILAYVPVEEAKLSSQLSMYIVFFMEMIVFALMFINLFYLVKTLVLKNLDHVNEGLKEITDGNLDTHLEIQQNKEFEALTNGINTTVDRLKQLIDEANAKIDAELEMAKLIQSTSVPTVFPKHSDGEIYALMDTAKEVGGDFYDFFFVPPSNLFVLIADVSGKGIPASLFMMKAKTLIKNLARQTGSTDIGQILTQANESLCESNDAEMFVTCWMGCINLRNGHVTFANAGHNKPVIKRVGQKPQFLDEKVNFVLAGMEGMIYKTQELDLEQGDTIYLYTDGITEATNSDNQLFGDQRLLDVLAQASDDPEDICKKVKEAADAFTGDAPQFDDMTELAFTRR